VPRLHLAGLVAKPKLVVAGGGEEGAVGAEAHAGDKGGVPLEGADLPARAGVPHGHALVVVAGEEGAIGAPAHAVARSLEGELLAAGARVPHLDFVASGAGEALAVGAPAHPVDGGNGPLGGEFLLTGAHVPHLHSTVPNVRERFSDGCGEALAIGAEAHAAERAGWPQSADLPAGASVPHLHFSQTGRGEESAVEAPAH